MSLLSRYGITREEYETMAASGCGICGAMTCTTGRRLAVDHDHSTNVVRGVLCTPCNAGLGYFFDSPANLRAAADYLERA